MSLLGAVVGLVERSRRPPGLTLEQLRELMPSLPEARARAYLVPLSWAMAEAGITTPLRKAAFLAQVAHESEELRTWEERPHIDPVTGKRYPEAYDGRTDLGNLQPGDGTRYKGRGPIQLTGRFNYRQAGKALGLPLEQQPELVLRPTVGFRTTAHFWTSRKLNALADKGPEGFDEITYRINGGQRGKASRDAYYERARKMFGA